MGLKDFAQELAHDLLYSTIGGPRLRASRSDRRGSPPQRGSRSQMESSLRQKLRETADDTTHALPGLLKKLDTVDEAGQSKKHNLNRPTRLNPNYCPSFEEPAIVNVVNEDTLNAALNLPPPRNNGTGKRNNWRPAIVNFANGEQPGGGWLNGALAQEESLCYRSSLAMSLHSRHYPLSTTAAEVLYSPYVLVMRDDLASGHHRMNRAASDLPVVSALTVAAIRRPPLSEFQLPQLPGQLPRKKVVFARDDDRTLTKDKMRLVLRLAAYHRHRQVVLGALGCGVYENPPEDIAHCWLEVLREDEFKGHWWSDVCFAVYDPKDEGNYEVFHRILHGKKV